MASTTITGAPQFVPLQGPPGYSIFAPGFTGTAELTGAGSVGARSAGRGFDWGLALLETALSSEHVTTVQEIELSLTATPGSPAAPMRSASGDKSVIVEVPDSGEGHLLMSVDDAGAVRWHLPEPAAQTAGGPSRGAGGGVRFRVPADLVVPPPGEADTSTTKTRSLLGAVSRRILKVLVYPITDLATAAAAQLFVSRWEAQKRPYRLRRFTPDDYVGAGAQELGPADVAHMAGGKPCLLFVHGTFSTSHAAFGDLPPQVMTDLFKRYEGSVFAFDHPTLASAPIDNVKWLMSLMSQMPATGITADIVCHSRGGLVARLLAERPQGFGLEASPLNVRRLVMAGVPSAGTPLADPDHMVDMIDRLTTVLTLAPSGLTVETLEALVIVLKVLGRGLLKGLDGLIAMRPDNEFLQRLNSGGTADGDYYAIASNYEPNDRGLKALLSGAVDGVVDFVFEQVGNDLVVPTDGVHGKNGHARFPVPQDKLLLLGREEAATHVQLFSQPAVGAKLQEWLG